MCCAYKRVVDSLNQKLWFRYLLVGHTRLEHSYLFLCGVLQCISNLRLLS